MKPFIRADVLRLATPILIEQSCVSLLSISSTVMAARLGPEAVSAIGMVDSINSVIGAVFTALGVGATVVVAQLHGKGDRAAAASATLQALLSSGLIACLVSILLACFPAAVLAFFYGGTEPAVMHSMVTYLSVTALAYPLTALTTVGCGALRGAGETASTMRVNVLINVVNVALSYLLIYGVRVHGNELLPAFGLFGAALSLVLTRAIGVLYLFWSVLWRSDYLPPISLSKLRFEGALQRALFAIGIPVSMESMIFNGGKLVVQVFIAGLGTTAIAANFIAFSISNFINIPGAALAVALTTLVGLDVGRQDHVAARHTMWHVLCIGWIALAVIGTAFYPLASWAVSLYTHDPEVIELGALLVRMNCVFLVCYPTTFILPYGFKGAGDARYTVLTTFTGMLVFRLCLGYVLGIVLGFGIVGVWCGVIADWFARSAMYLVRLRGTRWYRASLVAPGPARTP